MVALAFEPAYIIDDCATGEPVDVAASIDNALIKAGMLTDNVYSTVELAA